MTIDLTLENTEDLYENAPCGYLSIWPDGKILKANQTLCDWLDLDKEELVSEKHFQDLLSIGGKIFLDTHLMPMLRMQGEATEIKITLKGKNSKKVPSLINVKRIKTYLDDKPVYRLSVLNITQRNQYETELKIAKKQSEAALIKVKEMNKMLEACIHETSDQLKAAIDTSLSLLTNLTKEHSKLPPIAKDTIKTIETNTHFMKGMVDGLLDFVNMEHGNHHTSIPLDEIFREIQDLLKVEVETRQVQLQIEPLPEVLGVRSQIHKVLHGLLIAIIKSSGQEKSTITISWKSTEFSKVIWIRYQGAPLQEVTERQPQPDASTPPSINLKIFMEIIERHHGSLKLENTDEGNLISIAFPNGQS